MRATPHAAALDAIEEAADSFCEGLGERSVALRVYRGESEIFSYGVAGDAPRPLASILKIPLVMEVFERLQRGALAPADLVPRSRIGRTLYPSILEAFDSGHTFRLDELAALVLMTSDNPAADHLIQLVGFDGVNQAIRRLGASEATRLSIGFEDACLGELGRQNVGTAWDALLLVERACEEPRIRHVLTNSLRNNRIPLRLPDETPVAHKTGTLLTVANDAGIVYGERVRLAICFLSDGQPDKARTSIDIGDTVASIWRALGERVE